MMTVFSQPDAVDRIANATLISGDWDDGSEAVCMMSALVSGARSTDDCVTAGWPKWLVSLNVTLFDSFTHDCDDRNLEDRKNFALEVAKAVQSPRDMNTARDRFLLSLLATSQFSALRTLSDLGEGFETQCRALEQVVDLLIRRINGQDVTDSLPEVRRAVAQACYETMHPEAFTACRVASLILGHEDYVYAAVRCLVSMSAANALKWAPIEDLVTQRRKCEYDVSTAFRDELVVALNDSPDQECYLSLMPDQLQPS